MPRKCSSVKCHSSASFKKTQVIGLFVCPAKDCHARYKRKGDLARHEKKHAPNVAELMHRCPRPGCSFADLQEGNLRIHMLIHNDEKAFSCGYTKRNKSGNTVPCLETNSPSSLLRHNKREHGYVPWSKSRGKVLEGGITKAKMKSNSGELPRNLFSHSLSSITPPTKQEVDITGLTDLLGPLKIDATYHETQPSPLRPSESVDIFASLLEELIPVARQEQDSGFEPLLCNSFSATHNSTMYSPFDMISSILQEPDTWKPDLIASAANLPYGLVDFNPPLNLGFSHTQQDSFSPLYPFDVPGVEYKFPSEPFFLASQRAVASYERDWETIMLTSYSLPSPSPLFSLPWFPSLLLSPCSHPSDDLDGEILPPFRTLDLPHEWMQEGCYDGLSGNSQPVLCSTSTEGRRH